MAGRVFLLLGLAFLFSTATYLALSRRQRDILVARLTFRGRKDASATTPPRSLSPEKKTLEDAPTSPSDYKDAFPPSTRENLEKLAQTLPAPQREAVLSHEFDESTFEKCIIPFTQNYLECDTLAYTPMGVSIDEIKALGDFPDYSTLSGVPLPEAYKDFDIDRAKPRPYRPFRWNYHQTMCRYPLASPLTMANCI